MFELYLALFLFCLFNDYAVAFVKYSALKLKEIESQYVKDLKTGHCICGYG